MLAHLSRTSLSGVRSHASKTAKSSPSARISRPLVSGRSFWNRASFASSALKTSSSVTKAYYPIQKTTKRFHAGCGQPHGGDEIPGVGMERELRAHLNVTNLVIQDTSGNGSFYYIEVESPDFAGKPMLQCHKLVQGIIAKQIEQIHGFRIKTSVPKP